MPTAKDLVKSHWNCHPQTQQAKGWAQELQADHVCAFRIRERNALSTIILALLIDPQLPQEQAGFRPGMSPVDQVAKLTNDIEEGFDANLKSGTVFVNFSAVYDIVWCQGLILKLLWMLPNRH